MATEYWEIITEAIANDENKVKEIVKAKISASCPVNDSWLNASIRYGGKPGALKLTPEHVAGLVLDQEWKYYEASSLKPNSYFPRVILFKPPSWKKTFSLVRTKDERRVVLWDFIGTKVGSTEGVYVGLVPADCSVYFLQVDVKFMVLMTAPGNQGEPSAGPSRLNERSEESGETTPKQSGVVEGKSELERLAARAVEKYLSVPSDVKGDGGEDDAGR